ncbi:MAG: energy transducer TonB [Acidobacteriia bacterium]|nr:energy transducer TonB [Terriglobia bacterium]
MMTTMAHQFTQGSLPPRPGTSAAGPNPQAWKVMVGNKPVSARFSLLPNTKPRMSAMGTSLVIQVALVAFVVLVPQLFPVQMIPKAMFMVTEIAGPPLEIPAPPPPRKIPVAKIKKVEPPPPVEQPAPKPDVAKLFAPRIEAPKPKPRLVKEVELPKVNETFQPVKLELANNQPARPREPVKTGMMTSGSSAPATIDKPIDKIQTGGFGDPNGLSGPGDPNKRANIAQFGSPALPGGPGYGNGTGGAKGARGTVASTGFGNGVAIPPTGSARRVMAVQSTGFANLNDQVIEPPRKKADDAPVVEPVVILAKPKPMYSAEALKLNLEGEVLLDVVFPASGNQVHVNRIVKGLGHGLDEAAIRAAEQIKYKPALSRGQPVDFPAVIHIVFQMAY